MGRLQRLLRLLDVAQGTGAVRGMRATTWLAIGATLITACANVLGEP